MSPRARAFLLESVAAPAASVVLALAAGGVLILLAGKNPFSVYALLFGQTLGSTYGIGQMLAKATPLALTGLSVAVCFRAGLFNVGAEGEMTAGGMCAALAGLAYPHAPAWGCFRSASPRPPPAAPRSPRSPAGSRARGASTR